MAFDPKYEFNAPSVYTEDIEAQEQPGDEFFGLSRCFVPNQSLTAADFTDDGVIVAPNFAEEASFHTPKAAYSEQASMIDDDDDATPVAPSNFAQITAPVDATPVDSAPVDSTPVDTTPVFIAETENITEPESIAPEPVHVHEQTISELISISHDASVEVAEVLPHVTENIISAKVSTEAVVPEAIVVEVAAPIQPVFHRPANLRSSWGKAVTKTFAAPAPTAAKSVIPADKEESSKRRKVSLDVAPTAVTSTVNTTATSTTSSTFATDFIRTRSTKPLTEPQEFHFHTDDVVRKRKMQMIQEAIKESKQTRSHITKTESGEIHIAKSKSTISNAVSRVRIDNFISHHLI